MKTFINELKLNYNDTGNGTPLVFIHGFPFSSVMWIPQVEYFSKQFRVITYDICGHGESASGDEQFFLEYFVDDLFSLLDFLGIGKAIVAGLSMGGYIALRAYEKFPARFHALVLAGTKSEADSNEVKIKRALQARQVKKEGVKKFTEDFLNAVFCENTFSTNPKAIDLIRVIIENTSPRSLVATLLALAARTDTTHVLSSINIPTLLLVGEHDAVTPVSFSQAMKEKIPNAEMNIISSAGHLSNLENVNAFNSSLEVFLSKHIEKKI